MRPRVIIPLALSLAASAACASAPSPATGASAAPSARELHAEVSAMLASAAKAWNRGDLDAFMSDYASGPGTTFVGGRGLLHGREEIRAAYAPRFAPGGVRDSLSFESLEVYPLAPGVAQAIAYYVLSRGDSTVARGPTSLVLRRDSRRWLIVHDHSS